MLQSRYNSNCIYHKGKQAVVNKMSCPWTKNQRSKERKKDKTIKHGVLKCEWETECLTVCWKHLHLDQQRRSMQILYTTKQSKSRPLRWDCYVPKIIKRSLKSRQLKWPGEIWAKEAMLSWLYCTSCCAGSRSMLNILVPLWLPIEQM